jgi:CubicO group peptidase (beta-lactamase class C family)
MRGFATAILSFCVLYAVIQVDSARAQSRTDTVWPTKGWLTSAPEDQGMDAAELASLVTFGTNHGFDSLLVARHGRIVAEAYYAPYRADIPHEIHSCTKAVIGTLVGTMMKDGLLDSLDHPVLDFFADRHFANVDDKKQALTLQHLMDMTSGFDWDQGFEDGKEQTLHDMLRSADWTQFILDRPMAHAPGALFNYADANPNLLSAIMTRLTGGLAEEYAKQKLFDPMGIATFHWGRDPQGLTIGASTLSLLPRDMAKLGYLYLRHGEWEGRRLLPAGWADVLSHKTVNMRASYDPNQRYSNLFWVFPGGRAFMAVGLHGQLIAVFPDLDVVAVVTARKFVSFFALIEGIYAAVRSDAALPPDPRGAELLANAVTDATVEKASPVGPTPGIASTISGKTYRFPDNGLGLKSLTLFLTDPRPRVAFELASRDASHPLIQYEAPIGLDGLYREGTPADSADQMRRIRIAKGTWSDGQTFVIESQDLGLGGQRRVVLSFSGTELNLRRTDEFGGEASIAGKRGD